MMKVKFWAIAVLISIVGLGMGIPTPTLGETISQGSSQETLSEAERLNQQAFQLYQQGKYNEAIPLAEKVLAIRKKILGENGSPSHRVISNAYLSDCSSAKIT